MSGRPNDHGVPSSSAREDEPLAAQPNLISAPPVQALHRAVSAAQLGSAGEQRRPSLGPTRGLELPPLPRTTPIRPTNVSPSTTRIAGVNSILNPLEGGSQTGHRRKASQLSSPISSMQQLPPLAPTRREPAGPREQQELSPRSSRRILTPRSPSALHRAASLGQLNPQARSINAQQVPFPASPRRVYTVEPGVSGAPPLPTPPARAQQTEYGFPAPVSQRDAARRASTGTNRARNLSSSASPSTSYSSYSQAGQTSPGGPYAPAAGVPLLPATTTSELPRNEQRTASDPTDRQLGIPISSSGSQNVYQMMTLETASGTVQLPVDVQAASRVADEKRRRNAGASARFRQRRKEKEKEASTSIARLEQQVKELTEDADFYRNERAHLLSLVRGVPGMEQHLQRPPSPRQIRGHAAGQMPPSMMSRRSSYMRPQESELQSPERGRNVRRRTSTFSLPTGPFSAQLPPPPGPPLQPSYPPSGYTTPITPQGPGLLPSLTAPLQRPAGLQQQQQHPPLPGPPTLMQAQPQTGPYNPFERKPSDSGPREGR